jgi:hypothetical protein
MKKYASIARRNPVECALGDNEKIDFVFKLCFLGFISVQCLMILYINLFNNQNHLGYDAAHLYLKVIEIARQGTLFPDYYEQTSFGLIGSAPVAALFYKIFGNIFIAFGLANALIASALIGLFWSLLKHCGHMDILGKFLAVSVWISPFIAQFNNANPNYEPYNLLYVSAAFYNGNLLIGLCCMKAFLMLGENKPLGIGGKALAGGAIALCFLTGANTGMYNTVTFLAPLFCVVVFEVLRDKKLTLLRSGKAIFIYITIIISLIGIRTAEILLRYRASDSKNLAGALDFFKNLGSIYLGFLGLLGAIPLYSNILVFSKAGIVILGNFIIANTLLFMATKRFSGELTNQGLNANKAIILVNLFMFTVCYLTYGVPIFENRYLLPVYFALLILMARALSGSELLKRQFIRNIFYSLALFALIVSNAASWVVYSRTTIAPWNETIPAALDKYDVGLVYGTENIMTRDLRVLDTSRVYKSIIVNEDGSWGCHHWGDYKYYEEAGEYVGNTALISAPDAYEKLPPAIRLRYSFQENIDGNASFGLYIADAAYFDLSNRLPENERAVNYPFTAGISTQNGIVGDSGTLDTNGTAGHALFGPYAPVDGGVFTFILHYEYKGATNGVIGDFDIATKAGSNIVGSSNVLSDETEAVITGVRFDDLADTFEHRVWVNEGIEMSITSIEIIRE